VQVGYIAHERFALGLVIVGVLFKHLNSSRRKVTAVDVQIRIFVRSHNREDSVANTTADFEDLETVRCRLVVFKQQLGELCEKPVAVFEELVVVDCVELVPELAGILLKVFSFLVWDCRTLRA